MRSRRRGCWLLLVSHGGGNRNTREKLPTLDRFTWQRRVSKKSKRKIQGVPQSQAAALPRHQEEEETDKTKQAQIEQTYEKH